MQSLGMLNETQRIEMGRSFAERLMREGKDDNDRLNRMFNLLACRNPTDAERTACTNLLERMRTRYTETPADAQALLGIGDTPRNEQLDPAATAAWAQVALTVLASDVALLLY